MEPLLLDALKLLADATRLRILHILAQEELSVAEIQEVLDMGQSRISSHLAQLRQGSLLEDRRDGKKVYYRLSSRLPETAELIVNQVLKEASADVRWEADRLNLSRIVERRRQLSEQYFNTIAGRLGRNYCPGRSWEALGHCLLQMTPAVKIVDLGAGEGMLSHLLAKRADSVVCVDISPKMVEFGSDLGRTNDIQNLEYILGDIERVPLEGGQFDFALLSQALHHAQHPERAVKEAYRLLKKGGRLVILDLREHSFEKAHELYADLWLGFAPHELESYLMKAGFGSIEVQPVAREENEPHFETLLATGVK